MEQTVINHDIGRRAVGYMVNTVPSEENQQKVASLQQRIAKAFGDSVWVTPRETLHITLMDWIAPLIDYRKDKDELFKDIFHSYDEVLSHILKDKKNNKCNVQYTKGNFWSHHFAGYR